MTRKDYVLIASALLEARNITKEQGVIDWISDAIANRIEDENPRFDREKFLRACGINPVFTERMFTPSGEFIA